MICRSQRLRQITQTWSLIIRDIMRRTNSIIILIYIFFTNLQKKTLTSKMYKSLRTLHRRGAWKLGRLWSRHDNLLVNHVNFTCYCILTLCSRSIRVFIVSLKYNNIFCLSEENRLFKENARGSLWSVCPWGHESPVKFHNSPILHYAFSSWVTKKYISFGKTDLFYNSLGLYGNFTESPLVHNFAKLN